MKRYLVIGVAGGLATILSRLLSEEDPENKIIGIDSRDVSQCPKLKNLEVIQMKYSRGNFENLFRTYKFDVVYHLGRISSMNIGSDQLSKRLELSLMGTSRILDLSLRHKVQKVIILSTFHVYGALPDNSVFLPEEAPLKATLKHPELRDVVEMDQNCTSWMWQHQNEISTVILRPCNIIGAQIQNSMTKYLLSPFALKPIDYNPHFQFIHEFDMANILKRTRVIPTGVYNVAGDDYISLRDAFKAVGNKAIPFPISVANGVNSLLKKVSLDVPDYLLDYLKFSCLIDNTLLKKHLGKDYIRFSIKDALELIKLR